MSIEMDEVQNRKFREFIEYLAAAKPMSVPDKVLGDSPTTKAVNTLIENTERHDQLVLPADIVEPLEMEEDGGFDPDFIEELIEEIQMRTRRQRIPIADEHPLYDGVLGDAKDVKVGKIVTNDTGGAYTIAPQIWDPDLGTPAWIHDGVTVTGTTVPDCTGSYTRGGTYGGKVYYELNGFDIWWYSVGSVWVISVGVGDSSAGAWTRVVPIEGAYAATPPYTGTPTVAATTLSAREISQNANGTVGDFVIFWQQEDDNNDLETVMVLVTGPSASTEPFTKNFWFHITNDTVGWVDIDTTHNYLNRFVDTAAVWSSGAPAEADFWQETHIDMSDVNGAWVAIAQAQGLQRLVTLTNGIYLFQCRLSTDLGTEGDFILRVDQVTGALQALSENYVGPEYCVRVRLRIGQRVMATEDYNIP